jgi:hypothetical protein
MFKTGIEMQYCHNKMFELGFVLIQDASHIDLQNPLTHLQYG